MTEKDNRKSKHRFSIMLMLSATVFVILLATMGIVALAEMIVLNINILPDTPGLTNFILFSALASVLLGTGLAVLLSRFPLKSFDNMINSVDRLASGDYSTRLKMGGLLGRFPQVAEFSDRFNIMAEELENTEMLRSDFVNNFSHEFKTPIVSISGFAKLLQRDDLTDEQRKEYLSIIEDESLRLSSMATNVLNLGKIERQTSLTDVTEFNLAEQIRTCVLLLQNQWEKKALDFDIDLPECFIKGNEELLKQVWINLLDNAVKFSEEGHTIWISASEDAGSVSVSITNEGREIPPGERERIFNKFYQADKSHSLRGNGIGLTVVASVVRLHRGKVGVDSGNGKNTFTVTLPADNI